MATLRLFRHDTALPGDDGITWGEVVAWFSELVTRLDRGDLAGVAEAQAEMDRLGFKVSLRLPVRSGEAHR